MRGEYYARLSPGAQRMVDEIEKAASLEVEVRDEPVPAPPLITVAHARTISAAVAPGILRLGLHHGAANVDEDEVTHELVRLHRIVVQRVPQLDSLSTRSASIAAAVNLLLEHPFICRQHLALDPAFAAHLSEKVAAFWNSGAFGNLAGSNLRLTIASQYLCTRLLGPGPAADAMQEALGAHPGLGVRAAARRAMAHPNDKRQYVLRMFNFAGVPREGYILKHFRPGARSDPFPWDPL